MVPALPHCNVAWRLIEYFLEEILMNMQPPHLRHIQDRKLHDFGRMTSSHNEKCLVRLEWHELDHCYCKLDHRTFHVDLNAFHSYMVRAYIAQEQLARLVH